MAPKDPKPESEAPVDWTSVKKVLVVRLRSIGDTVLSTPVLAVLRRELPNARIDILLEEWVAPLLEGLEGLDNVIVAPKSAIARLKAMRAIRKTGYDAVINLHGGTTATFFSFATGARYRIGYRHYQYSSLYNIKLTEPFGFWEKDSLHSAEQQLAMAGLAGLPVEGFIPTALPSPERSEDEIRSLLAENGIAEERKLALIHPSASSFTKEWSKVGFAAVIDHLAELGLASVMVGTNKEHERILKIAELSQNDPLSFTDLELPQVVALARRSALFVGNDSGIAHIATAVGRPAVVIFGSSNIDHWRPWTDGPCRVVTNPLPCQPCAGYTCEVFPEPKCIQGITTGDVISSIDEILAESTASA